MSRLIHVIVAVAALAFGLGAAHVARANHVVGNPGDPLRILVEEARDDARIITIRVPADDLVTEVDAVRNFYRDHYDAFDTTLRDADLVFGDDAAPACALAVRSELRIYLSYPTCRAAVQSKADAIKLLFHETTHLLGNEDEHLADQVALAIYSTWINLDANRTPRWDALNPNGSPGERSAHAWVAFRDADQHDKLFVYGGCNENDDVALECSTFLADGGIYDITAATWQALPPLPAVFAPGTGGPRAYAKAVFTGTGGPAPRQIIVSGGCSGLNHVCNSTFESLLIFDLASNSWRSAGSDSGPEGRILHHVFWTGSAMLLWGGVADPAGSGLGRSLVDGWLFDPTTNLWSPLPSPDATVLSTRRHASAVLTGTDQDPEHRDLIVYGGCDRQVGRYCPTYLADGAILHLDGAVSTWRKIPAGSLGARAFHSAVWTGTQMIVWGGQNRHALRDGAIFTPGATAAEDAWLLVSGVVDDGRWQHEAVWTGERMLVWGGQSQLLEPAPKLLEFFLPTPATPFGRWNVPVVTAAPVGRWLHTAAWTGRGLIVWGGISEDRSYLNSGGIYLPNMSP